MKKSPNEQINLVIGFASGLVLIAIFSLIVVLISGNQNKLHAQTAMGDSNRDSIIVGSSPIGVTGTPYIYVLYSRPMDDISKKVLGISSIKEREIKRLTLALYATSYTGQGIDLRGVRDITFDLQMISIPQSSGLNAVGTIKEYYVRMIKDATEGEKNK